MVELYEEENLFISVVMEPSVETSEKDTKSANAETDLKIAAEVVASQIEKGNPIIIPNHAIPESDRKLGLEELNTAKDSTEDLSMNDPDVDDENVVDDSVQPSIEKIDDQKGGVPDVGTSLGQQDKQSKDTGTHDEDIR